MARFEAVLYDGEDGERLPEWQVVEWTFVNLENGAKSGRTVWKTIDMEDGEEDANKIAAIMQEAYNRELAEDLA